MSNEELVIEIQAGMRERMVVLWERMEKLVKWKANRVMTALAGCGGVEFEDLVQCGYPALVEAVENYAPTSGKFSSWFMLYLKTAFAEATGYRTQKGKKDPVKNALSLDMPLTDDPDSGLFGDLIPDKLAAAAMESIEEKEYRKQLHEVMESVLSEVPESDVLRLRYFQNMTLEATHDQLGITVSEARTLEQKGIRRLRTPRFAAVLKPFCDFDYYSTTGLSTFKHSGMSVQERYLIKMESNSREIRT